MTSGNQAAGFQPKQLNHPRFPKRQAWELSRLYHNSIIVAFRNQVVWFCVAGLDMGRNEIFDSVRWSKGRLQDKKSGAEPEAWHRRNRGLRN
jgi:hypothetical protein